MPTYHIELRRFPKTLTRFNQTGQQVGAIVLPWIQERILDLDGENWAPYEATITIIEGPPIPVERLSLGRGWPIAVREGTDVTDRVLAEARQALADGSATGTPQAPPAPARVPGNGDAPAADYPSAAAPAPAEKLPGDQLALGVELAGLLGPDPVRLLAAWREVAGRAAGLTPAESLALAEREMSREGGRER